MTNDPKPVELPDDAGLDADLDAATETTGAEPAIEDAGADDDGEGADAADGAAEDTPPA